MKEFKRILDFILILNPFFFFAFFRKELDEFPTDEGNTHPHTHRKNNKITGDRDYTNHIRSGYGYTVYSAYSV